MDMQVRFAGGLASVSEGFAFNTSAQPRQVRCLLEGDFDDERRVFMVSN